MIIVRNKMAGFLLSGHYSAMCIWPFVFIRAGNASSGLAFTLNHEHIHARQQMEMLWLLFFVWYGAEYLIRLVQYRNHHLAYHAISFEREAFLFGENLNYLKERKLFAWVAFL